MRSEHDIWKRDCAGLALLAGCALAAGIGLIPAGGTWAPAFGVEALAISAMFAPGLAWRLSHGPEKGD